MTSATSTADRAQSMMASVASHWGLVLAMGLLSILIGVLAIVYPGATLVTIAIFFAAWLFVSGIYSIIGAFTAEASTGPKVLSVVIGVLSVIVGFALLRSPFQSLEVLIFVIGVIWVAQGIIRFVTAFEVKQGRNWAIFTGILSVIAGIIVLEYPGMSAVTLAIFGGIWLIIFGVMESFAAYQLRKVAKAVGST
jgi:uncharacterized membrane protein HdeD (DUF308 family)